MDNLERVKEITAKFVANTDDRAELEAHFAPGFVHLANGRQSDLKGYAAHLAGLQRTYAGFALSGFDELFAAGDRVVAAYTLEGRTKEGTTRRIPVIAIWRFEQGKVVSLREVDGA